MKIVRLKTSTKAGFTMVEVLVVITIIIILAAIAGSLIGGAMSNAKVANTRATIEHLHETITERMNGFSRHLIDMEKQSSIPAYVNSGDVSILGKHGAIAKGRKRDFKDHFPQYIDPKTGALATTAADVSEILYEFIVNGERFGAGAEDMDQGPLASSTGDTDGDGKLEFVDGWGNPLRFYRWPTALYRDPSTGTLRNPADVAKALITTPNSKLDVDNDDPLGMLGKKLTVAQQQLFRIDFHQINTYSAPLIISAGPDGELGLYEPIQDSTTFGHLANWDPAKVEEIYDNITNQNQTGGSN